MLTWKDSIDGSNKNIFEMMFFHDLIFVVLILIGMFVGLSIFIVLTNKNPSVSYEEYSVLEIIWTVFPMFILLLVFFPSFFLLYKQEKKNFNLMKKIIHITGHQWYWEFCWNDLKSTFEGGFKKDRFNFNSVLKKKMGEGQFRLLDTNVPLFLSAKKNFLLNIDSDDVIHSFSVPSLGIKVDAVPGRINEYLLETKYKGVFFGQCSEICGVLHAKMPIKIIVY